MKHIQLVVFDMSGTTVVDKSEVLDCFFEAAVQYGINTTPEHINTMMGWSKIEVFRTLLREELGDDHPEIEIRAQLVFKYFRRILEAYYFNNPVDPTPGTMALFYRLKSKGVKIALTTGFYREVTNILLYKLGWDIGLNRWKIGNGASVINASVTSDEVEKGRPAPDMIFRAMKLLNVSDPAQVIKIGDTPSDLKAGKNAGCAFTFGITSGSHSREELSVFPNDGLFHSMEEVAAWFEEQENAAPLRADHSPFKK
ncbi:MAG TPA: HAD hydrolase-like protein [Saprospiraceae bacterium]|nr:HAD hydrolase-like protein [Saprospiraceae bacterium]